MSAVKIFFKRIGTILPEIKKPDRKVSLRNRLLWSLLILVLYMMMGGIPLYGVSTSPDDPFASFRIIFASSRGTLLELGIGPIVTAGLIMQLLKGADIIKFDFTDPEERAVFTSATKFLTIIVTVVQATALVISNYLVFIETSIGVVVVTYLQLIIATILVMLMDEMIQKGWGIGSGISLFIAAGVARTIFINLFSPITIRFDTGTEPFGLIPLIITKIFSGDYGRILIREGNYPSLLSFLMTLATIFIILYAEGVRIELPISHARYRGIRSVYPVKLLYVSNIPIILASTLIGDLQIMANVIWSTLNPSGTDPLINMLVYMETTENGGRIIKGGLLYYLIGPSDLFQAMEDPIRTIVFIGVMTLLAVMFAYLWVEVGGLSSASVSQQLIDSGMQVPGFRRRAYSVNILLSKYIPVVTIIGGIFVGVIAAVSQILGVFGGGMGILLMIDILMNLYQLLLREQIEEYYPIITRLIKV